ncbi:DNA methyltransferase [Geodermatophilus poikilotrophus]|uniref:DNA methyltransferase n=1 Tax=Geodermatophilus poikilotrophus TaxID=1333667 RepID=UPI001587DE92|nr:histone-like nucleoid-structuring protein Lsr2 [Geodermatophilus poikilotrophus]
MTKGDSRKLILDLPDESLDVVVTSPPYWGQRMSEGTGVEEDPREYVEGLRELFGSLLTKVKPSGLLWINIGDAFNTPVNWREADRTYSTLGPDAAGLNPDNSAYVKPRHKRRAFIEKETPWLTYGNMLGLPYRLVLGMQDDGWLSRGEVIWKKRNPMPEGRCRRPHRQHESIYLFARDERHSFRTSPPVGSVWEFPNEKIDGLAHYSRFPLELPKRCLEAYGTTGEDVIAFDPFSGSGTTGVAARRLGMSYVGFEIDGDQVDASNKRLMSDESALQPVQSTRGRPPVERPARPATIRAWAIRQGIEVPDRGRIPDDLRRRFLEATTVAPTGLPGEGSATPEALETPDALGALI